ncbi:DUF86 domain-containing protein [Corallococcus exiguus]|uniref:HepT-like ribonuclease domain-containing protein n=1 Tax=Corallococcus exiguus TaxID=83462 RepID=UPI0014756226|nr:HepT-like ribonuclease domain-containing protein [Corallococcus exiguus]NNC00791.1 DUF86 domain-containing protein [Corallococcus exiguus]
MTEDTKQRLADMRAYARVAHQLVGGRALGSFLQDDRTRLAIQYCLLVIGEASVNVDASTREAMTQVPWLALRGMRNRLAHAYSSVDPGTVYITVVRDLPALMKAFDVDRSES